MAGRWYATVDVPSGRTDLPYTALVGLPGGPQSPMPPPVVLVIEERPDGFFLVGYSETGAVVGDTWHRDLDEAMGQADFAYAPHLGQWRAIPAGVADAASFALDQRAAT